MKKSSPTGTPKSESSAPRKPSLYLGLGFLAMAVSAFLSIDSGAGENRMLAHLRAKGWKPAERAPCGEGTGFFELDGEEGTLEFYVDRSGAVLTAKDPPWPEPALACRRINEPSFVEEI